MINFIIKTDDFALAEEKINTIIRTMDNPDVISYNLDEDSLYRLIDELTTISLFDNPKLVILKGANSILDESDEKITLQTINKTLSKGKKKKNNNNNLENMISKIINKNIYTNR